MDHDMINSEDDREPEFEAALSGCAFSVHDQVRDVVNALTNRADTRADLESFPTKFKIEFPEWDSLIWSGSWVDHEESGVDPDYMNWVIDWLENSYPVLWVDGEPYLQREPQE